MRQRSIAYNRITEMLPSNQSRPSTLNVLDQEIDNILKENSSYTITDSLGRIEFANEAFCKILCREFGELIGEPHPLTNPKPNESEKLKCLWNSIRNGEIWEGTLKGKSNNGKSIWLKTKIVPIQAQHEENFKYLWIYSDITETKAESKKLKDAAKMYRKIYDSVKTAIIVVTDQNGTIIKWNSGAENSFGYSQNEILGKHYAVLMASKLHKSHISDFFKTIREHRKSQRRASFELKCVDKEGKKFPVELIVSTWNIKDKTYYALKMLNISKRIEFQNRLIQKTEELELYLYRAAHDLNAPFSSAQGLINLMKEELNIEKMQVLVQMLEKTIDHAQVLANGLAKASLVSAKKNKLQEIDFELIVENVMEKLKGHKNFGNIKFNIEIETVSDFVANPDLIFTLFQNVIQNAIKYALPQNSGHEPMVDVRLQALTDEILIAICDNGQGIKKKNLDRVFEMYYQGNTEKTQGSNGLGLYTVKKIVESLNGAIKVESKLRKGACFVIRLPRTK